MARLAVRRTRVQYAVWRGRFACFATSSSGNFSRHLRELRPSFLAALR